MSNIVDQIYAYYERLASAKLNQLVSDINSHNHGAGGGVTIDVAGGAIPTLSIYTDLIQDGAITADKLATGAINSSTIQAGAVNISHIDLSSIHLSSDGYAVYSP